MTAGAAPRFCIVTVVRNDLAGLQRTWASLEVQTCADFEWIVVDGASTDGTAEWLNALDDGRLSWTSEPDHGTYDAMNKGMSSTTGALVQFLNAGDVLASPEVLGLVSRDWAEHAWSWAFGIVRFHDLAGEFAGVYSGTPYSRRLVELGYRYVPHPACFFTRDLLERVGGYDLRYPVAADQDLILRAARQAEPRVIGEILVDFATGGASAGQAPDAFVWQARRIRRDRKRLVGANPVTDLLVSSALASDFRLRALAARAARRDAVGRR
jgi:glycosyltransferase involved in cell wall biosynthesis